MLAALLLCAARPAAAALTDYPFRLVTRGTSTDYDVTAENGGPAPITVCVTASGANFASDRAWPLLVVVPPFTKLALGHARAQDRAAGNTRHVFGYSYHFGRFDAVPDPDAVYRLPFADGHGYEVSQAYGGELTTHNNRANLHAVDFALPLGSAVTAAREGVVVDVTLRHLAGGYDIRLRDMANAVTIAHDDGTLAEYAHLSPGAALVAVGQRVIAGQLLAYSGSTGYSSGPHLHFIVSRPVENEGKISLVSVPVQFQAGNPAVRFSARAGTTVWANYGTAAGSPRNADTDAASAATGLTPRSTRTGAR